MVRGVFFSLGVRKKKRKRGVRTRERPMEESHESFADPTFATLIAVNSAAQSACSLRSQIVARSRARRVSGLARAA